MKLSRELKVNIYEWVSKRKAPAFDKGEWLSYFWKGLKISRTIYHQNGKHRYKIEDTSRDNYTRIESEWLLSLIWDNIDVSLTEQQ